MKKILLSILMFFAISEISGQLINNYGIKIGLAFSNQDWEYKEKEYIDFDSKTGASIRIFADLFDYSFFKLETELGYTRKGMDQDVIVTTTEQPNGTGESIIDNFSFDYFSFSTMAKIKYDLKNFTPYLLIGPQINLIFNETFEDGWEIIFDKFQTYNLGFSIGAGTEIEKITAFPILLEYRYEMDLLNNYDSSEISIKNYSHIIHLGVIF